MKRKPLPWVCGRGLFATMLAAYRITVAIMLWSLGDAGSSLA